MKWCERQRTSLSWGGTHFTRVDFTFSLKERGQGAKTACLAQGPLSSCMWPLLGKGWGAGLEPVNTGVIAPGGKFVNSCLQMREVKLERLSTLPKVIPLIRATAKDQNPRR